MNFSFTRFAVVRPMAANDSNWPAPNIPHQCRELLLRIRMAPRERRLTSTLAYSHCQPSVDLQPHRPKDCPALSGTSTSAWLTSLSAAKAVPGGGDFGSEGKRRSGVGTRRVLRDLTRRGCLNAAHELSAVSSAARPQAEQRSGVGAKHRPPAPEPLPGIACRAAPTFEA